MGSKSNTKLHRDADSFRTKLDKPSNYTVNKSSSNKWQWGSDDPSVFIAAAQEMSRTPLPSPRQ